jgi:hypothetical protein
MMRLACIVLLATVQLAASQFAALHESCDTAAGEFLDISSLECSSCADDSDGTGRNNHKVPNLQHLDSNGTALSCVCASSYRRIAEPCSFTALRSGTCTGFTCSACTTAANASSVAYSDSSACVVSEHS